MLITYIRSSSYNNWDFCQMQYYLNYVLGLPRKSSKKADQGTIVHKVLEILAKCKQVIQTSGGKPCIYDPHKDPTSNEPICQEYPYIINDEHIGEIKWFYDDFLKPTALSNKEIDAINKTRINKYKYKHDAKIPYGTIHYGQEMVDDLIERVYEYYSGEDWMPVDKKDCRNWVWMALEYKNGIMDPRQTTIWAAEPHFDFEIKKPWAHYERELPNGEKISGYLGIKGTIDLITKVNDGILEIRDYKTGQRIDWACKSKKNEKTYEKLQNDFQLLLYNYAAHLMYPKVDQIITTIFFIRDGGPFTIHMDSSSIIEVENRLRQRFKEIKSCQLPAMQDVTQRDFRCTRICDYYNMVAPNGHNMCRYIHDLIDSKGIDYVTHKYTREGFSIGHYQEPGEKK